MRNVVRATLAVLSALCCLMLDSSHARGQGEAIGAPPFEFFKGDRIAIVGNTLADRMQHLGHGFETQLQLAYPGHGITLRNLGFSGDELNLRLRSADFGSPDQWLAKVKASVVIAMFGYNESWAGKEGLEKFESELSGYVDHLRAEKFDGSQPPRVILCSPTAFESGAKRPDANPVNDCLAQYTAAIAKVAAAKKVKFVDLFTPTLAAFSSDSSCTINGVHLSEKGYGQVEKVLGVALLGGKAIPQENAKATRQAVADKDWYWFQRYRVTDGYSIFGGRADLKFVGGQTNRVVMARELEILEVMTSNRDNVIHKAALGESAKADDSNTPDFIPVVTNKPGPLEGGKHLFLSGDKALEKMTVSKGLKVNLFASEETWKELGNPVQMAWDSKGRLWVAVWPTYPHWKPKTPMN
ncbi:MAG: GDSL-type esterase/lipase family protein, partial [Gemmataceae bacterium]